MDFNINFSQLHLNEKLQMYIENMKPVLNRRALFSDGTEDYRSPCEPMQGDLVNIRLRTARDNAESAYLVLGDRKILMSVVNSDELFDYYQCEIQLEDQTIEYYFEINIGRTKCYYNQRGAMRDIQPYYNFKIVPGFKTPDWAKGAVMYQILVDRFYNGDPSNDVEDMEYVYIGEGTSQVTDWDKYPAAMGVREFYGGDLKGVKDKLDYLQDMGVEVIYFNPIFVSPSNHKYDIQDYDYIDPHYGVIVKEEGETLKHGDNNNTNATKYITRVTDLENLEASNRFFIELVEEIHRRGMRVILDGVFNHCGSFNKWLDRERIYENQKSYEKGAYISKESPYNTFFKFRDDDGWPYNDKYDGWWGHDTLPKLNYEESPILYEYIMNIARKWVSPPFNVDGWRLDVAADLGHSNEYNHKFWKDFRKNVKEVNPDAIILAEHYGDPSSWLQGDEWDTVMNYDAFMEPVTWFLTGMEKHSDEFRGDLLGNYESFFGAMSHHMSRFLPQSLYVAMNELSNHDHSRFLTRTNRKVGRTHTMGPEVADQNINKGIFKIAVVIQMTWPGAPTLYYGDEAGVCGWTDPDNRRTYPWGKEDIELINFHKAAIMLHKSSRALKTGSVVFLFGSHKIISYGRFNYDDKIVVIVNNNYESFTVKVPVWEIGITDRSKMEKIMVTTQEGYDTEPKYYSVNDGKLEIIMEPISSVVLRKYDM